jgi:hypothetical protein
MKRKTILLSLVALFAVSVACFAADNVNVGSWKLNEAKSKIPAGAAKNTMVTCAATGDNFKVTVDGVDAAGKPAHNEWTGKFDGKDYAVTGDPASDMRSYKQVDANTQTLTIKMGGKVTQSGTVKISADGKTRTVTLHMTDAKGMKVTTTAVYDKQ